MFNLSYFKEQGTVWVTLYSKGDKFMAFQLDEDLKVVSVALRKVRNKRNALGFRKIKNNQKSKMEVLDIVKYNKEFWLVLDIERKKHKTVYTFWNVKTKAYMVYVDRDGKRKGVDILMTVDLGALERTYKMLRNKMVKKHERLSKEQKSLEEVLDDGWKLIESIRNPTKEQQKEQDRQAKEFADGFLNFLQKQGVPIESFFVPDKKEKPKPKPKPKKIGDDIPDEILKQMIAQCFR